VNIEKIKKLITLYIILTFITCLPYWFKFDYLSNHLNPSPSIIKPIIKTLLVGVFSSSIITLLLISLKKYRIFIIIPLIIFWIFTTYILITFGSFDLSLLASIMDTTPSESSGYISSISIPRLLFFVIPYSYILFRLKSNLKFKYLKRFLLSLAFICYIPFILNGTLSIFNQYKYLGTMSTPRQILEKINKTNIIDLALKFDELLSLKKEENQKITPQWTNVVKGKNTLKFNYIVIVGESAPRKDFSYYNGENLTKYVGWKFISNAVSPATNTRESIPRILSVNSYKNIDENLNIIDLANQAGITTYWFSNQGFLGKYDTPISKLGKRAKYHIFHNKGSYESAESDNRLFIDLSNALKKQRSGNLVFLHTIGSHPPFCKRSQFYEKHIKNFNATNEKSCYKDAIYNTEIYINKINSIMSKTANPYKIIYFSDHGLSDVKYSPYKVHGVGKAFSLDAIHIPLIFINSESKEPGKLVKKTYFMRDFVHTFSDWMEIDANQIDHNKSIYSKNINQNKYIYEGSELIKLGK